jgi:hypothetical protein
MVGEAVHAILLQKSFLKGVWAVPSIVQAEARPSFLRPAPMRSGICDGLEPLRYKLDAVPCLARPPFTQ